MLPSTPGVPQSSMPLSPRAVPTTPITPFMSEKAHIAALQKGTPRPDAVLQRAGRLSTEEEVSWSWEPSRATPQAAISPGSIVDRDGRVFPQKLGKATQAVSSNVSAKSAGSAKSTKATGGAKVSSEPPGSKRGGGWRLVKSATKSALPDHISLVSIKIGRGSGEQKRQQKKKQTDGRPRRVSFDAHPITGYFPPDSEPSAVKKEDAVAQEGNNAWKSLGMAARRKSRASASKMKAHISTGLDKALKRLSPPQKMFQKPKSPSPIPPVVTLAPIGNGFGTERRLAPELDSVFPGGEAERVLTPPPIEERPSKRRSRVFDLNRVNKKLLKGEKERLMREADGGLIAAEAAAFKGTVGDDKDQATPDKKPTPPSQEATGPANEDLSMLLAPDVRMQLQAEREEAELHIKTIPAKQELSQRVREFDFHMTPHKRGSKMCPLTAGKDVCVYHGRKTAPVVESEPPSKRNSVDPAEKASEDKQAPAAA
ncbi:hypothetical protein MAPG_05218 [Magnaporthiopsis poae ATCC 64411]|uniref:Uncharacterized protein n=1 Tax=Magnaporthiopsis poae (strain ATCC 64411 / 73-15) TaxID=644358 RepID=A0A0C4DYT9_MAGP6|nr:hypothetical protein MAPG_05218 [Magnaporthiopsis poae ATCC 64411]